MAKVHKPIGSKERLFEMFERVNKTKVKESFDAPAEKDEEYLNSDGSEEMFDEQPNKYDELDEEKKKTSEIDENLDEISLSGIKQAGKFIGQSIMNTVNRVGDSIKNYGDELAKNYQRGARDNVIKSLEKVATEFAKDFAIMLKKINDRAIKAGDEPIKVDAIAQTIRNKIVSDFKTGEFSGIDLAKYKSQREGIGESEELEGGLADGDEPIQYDPQQILKGMDVEMEHTDDPKIALEITMDHLAEIPDYYDHLEDMEAEATAGDDQEREVDIDLEEEDDDRSADSLLYPSSHWTNHYTLESLGENFKFKDDGRGNLIHRDYSDSGLAIRKTEEPMGSNNFHYYVVELLDGNNWEFIPNTKSNSQQEAEQKLIAIANR